MPIENNYKNEKRAKSKSRVNFNRIFTFSDDIPVLEKTYTMRRINIEELITSKYFDR
ncbi:hypothetical protein [Rodentibacter rarus]|uniref:hypothetical protein n=1 Tax=Rodentibacter rarus TaxID=1908260 RepID=UPI00130141AC|nr:hypothetical protein [Rodentibacter rarus]